MDSSARSIGREVARIATEIVCPYCGAGPGTACRTRTGKVRVSPHQDRWWQARRRWVMQNGVRT